VKRCSYLAPRTREKRSRFNKRQSATESRQDGARPTHAVIAPRTFWVVPIQSTAIASPLRMGSRRFTGRWNRGSPLSK
jgi:hypothetical protein